MFCHKFITLSKTLIFNPFKNSKNTKITGCLGNQYFSLIYFAIFNTKFGCFATNFIALSKDSDFNPFKYYIQGESKKAKKITF